MPTCEVDSISDLELARTRWCLLTFQTWELFSLEVQKMSYSSVHCVGLAFFGVLRAVHNFSEAYEGSTREGRHSADRVLRIQIALA